MTPPRPLKPCGYYRGCPNLTDGRYCAQHQHLEQEGRREADRTYQERRTDTEEQRFYNSEAWRKLRARYARRHPFCEPCEKAGRLTAMRIVHHKIPIKNGGARLASSNLESVCASHQARAHRSKIER